MDKFSDIKYQRPDVGKLKNKIKRETEFMKKAEEYKDAKEYFLKIQSLFHEYETAYVVASIRNTLDTTDKFYDQEMKFFNKNTAMLMPLLKKLNKVLLQPKFRTEAEKEYGKQFFIDIENEQKLQKITNIPDQIKEGKICQEYQKSVAACKTEFNGEQCNFYGLLKYMESTDRQKRKEAFEAFAKLYESVSEILDKQYDKLVKIRCRIAKRLGFDNYIDYIYLSRRRYQYNSADVSKFRENVKNIIVPICIKLKQEQAKRIGVENMQFYDEKLVFPDGNADPVGTVEEQIDAAKKIYIDLSKETGEFFDFITEYELFDLKTRPGKHLGGYCTFLFTYKAPFIFSNFNGTNADVQVLTHEAGHAFQLYTAARCLPLLNMIYSTSEVMEIHSMSMELFTFPWMEKLLGINADKFRYSHLVDCLETIPYITAVDEFQHRVYERPSMNSKERRTVWKEIEKKYLPDRDYDGNEFMENGGFWMTKQHIFLYPFYYIDYALAQICAFQFYGKAKTDRKTAWNDYYELCKAGGSKSYFELLKLAGLENPFEERVLRKAVKVVTDELDKSEY